MKSTVVYTNFITLVNFALNSVCFDAGTIALAGSHRPGAEDYGDVLNTLEEVEYEPPTPGKNAGAAFNF